MAISLTTGDQVRRWGVFQSATTAGPATSTATQTMPITSDVVELTGPTGAFANFYTMADGDEGQMIMLRYLATGAGGTTGTGGDIQVVPSNIGPQGSITFRNDDDYWLGQFIAGKWRTINRTTWELGVTTASGSIPLTVDQYRLMRATGTDQVFTLAAGHGGQEILITALTGTTVRTVTPAAMDKFTSINMGNDVAGAQKRYALLRFTAGAWTMISPINLSTTGTDFDATVFVT